MSDYQQYLNERERIDYLFEKGYQIKAVTENLSGAFVDFIYKFDKQSEPIQLHIQTAEARKYFSVRMMKEANVY